LCMSALKQATMAIKILLSFIFHMFGVMDAWLIWDGSETHI